MRAREMGIRAALGASRWRLVRGLVIEGLVLSIAGAALGVLLAYFGVQAILAWLPSGLPRVADVGLDTRVLLVTTVGAMFIAAGGMPDLLVLVGTIIGGYMSGGAGGV